MADDHVLDTRVYQHAVGRGANPTLQQLNLPGSVLCWIGDTRIETADQEIYSNSRPSYGHFEPNWWSCAFMNTPWSFLFESQGWLAAQLLSICEYFPVILPT